MVIGLAVTAGLFCLLVFSYQITDFVVDRLFAHISIPEGREPPQTAHAIPTASADIQILGGQGGGLSCSIPGWLETWIFRKNPTRGPLSLQMRQACAMHDYCYRHGAATYGYSQEDCDYLLLDHGQRLCRFLRLGEDGVEDCGRDAKKVLLGVRMGGNASFKRIDREIVASAQDNGEPADWADDFKTSTYFEFDPYPIRSMKYVAFRVADAPRQCGSRGTKRKALYAFTVRPAGLQVSIVIWAGKRRSICREFVLPGWPERLTGAPNVLRHRLTDEGSEDWFVWWQRYGMDKTGGRFVGIAPARATDDDWKVIFPGASTEKRENSSDIDSCGSCRNESVWTPSQVRPPPAVFIARTGKKSADDNNASEYHAAPGLEAESGLRLMTLRVHTCVTDEERSGANTLCFSDLVIDPGGPERQVHEPMRVRDDRNGGGEKNESKRYRNLSMPPIAVAGVDKQPVLLWFRRGDKDDGSNFSDTSLMRRAACAPGDAICDQRDNTRATGRNMGTLRLLDFKQEDEPVIVFGRVTASPDLISIRAEPAPSWFEFWRTRRAVRIASWRLDPPEEVFKPYRPPTDVPKMDIDGGCGEHIDASWLVRTPVVLAREDGTGIVFFSRALHVPGSPNLRLDIQQVAIARNLTCKNIDRLLVDTGLRVDPDSPAVAMSLLRQRPVLIMTDNTYKRTDIVLADALNPEASLMLIEGVDLHD